MTSKELLDTLKKKGHKLTFIRRFFISLFLKTQRPLSAQELEEELETIGERVNKTSVYRELMFLKEQGIVREVRFLDEKVRYESTFSDHHHHVVCTNCNQVANIESRPLEGQFYGLQKYVSEHTGYRDINHALEFFGLCVSCQN